MLGGADGAMLKRGGAPQMLKKHTHVSHVYIYAPSSSNVFLQSCFFSIQFSVRVDV